MKKTRAFDPAESRPTVGGRIFTGLIYFLLYLPIFVLIAFSFNASKSRSVWTGFTFKWYGELFRDSGIMSSFYLTLILSLAAAAVATVLGTFAAVGFYGMKRRWRAAFLEVNNIPLMNADIVTGVSLCLMFVAGRAILGYELGFGTLLIAHLTFDIPYVILSVMPKLYQLDRNLVDAAQDLGCTWLQAFFKVVLPEISPGIVNGAIIAFTMSVDDFVISYFTAGSKIMTLSMRIYSMTRKRVPPTINAVSTILFVSVLLLLVIINVRETRQEAAKKRRQLN